MSALHVNTHFYQQYKETGSIGVWVSLFWLQALSSGIMLLGYFFPNYMGYGDSDFLMSLLLGVCWFMGWAIKMGLFPYMWMTFLSWEFGDSLFSLVYMCLYKSYGLVILNYMYTNNVVSSEIILFTAAINSFWAFYQLEDDFSVVIVKNSTIMHISSIGMFAGVLLEFNQVMEFVGLFTVLFLVLMMQEGKILDGFNGSINEEIWYNELVRFVLLACNGGYLVSVGLFVYYGGMVSALSASLKLGWLDVLFFGTFLWHHLLMIIKVYIEASESLESCLQWEECVSFVGGSEGITKIIMNYAFSQVFLGLLIVIFLELFLFF